jgi:sodium-dependent dicarboxylate transporter 2/3/5
VVALALGLFFQPDPGQPAIGYMAAVVALMAIWWMTEAIPLAATSLLPFLLFPSLGILDSGKVASSYINSTIFLFLGGFLIALAMERWNLHRRIALAIISVVGSKPSSMVLGFMLAAGFLSMWISNTATAVMMLPIGMALLTKVEDAFGVEKTHTLGICIMLGIAYGSSIGGVATLVGTPPNMVLAAVYNSTFPEKEAVTFGKWILFGLPFAMVMMLGTWLLLTKVVCRLDPTLVLNPETVRKERSELGRMSFAEKSVSTVFAAAAVLWIFRSDLNFGGVVIPGWQRLWTPLEALNDGSIAIGLALLLFLLPSRRTPRSEPLLDSDVFARVPWGIILLFGGGFALADGFTASGLSRHVAAAFTSHEALHPLLTTTLVSFGITFLTELTSNTATTQMLLPLLASTAVGLGIHPLVLMIPATLSASMAFMLPVATPPNAIVFSSQRIKIMEMAKVGVVINLFGLVVIVLLSYFLLPLIFDLRGGG